MLVKHSTRPRQWAGVALVAALLGLGMWQHETPDPLPVAATAPVGSGDRSFTELASEPAVDAPPVLDAPLSLPAAPPAAPAR